MEKTNVAFERHLLKTLREDLKKLKIKIPKVSGLGCFFNVGNKSYEIQDESETQYGRKYQAISKYLEEERPKENKILEEYTEKMAEQMRKGDRNSSQS